MGRTEFDDIDWDTLPPPIVKGSSITLGDEILERIKDVGYR